MGIFEIISAIVFIIACVFIIIVVLMKETKTQMSQTISGSSADSFYQKNAGRTKEAMLNKATIVAAIIFFVLAILVNVFNVYFGAKADDDTSDTSSTPSSSITESDGSLADEDNSGALTATIEESAPESGGEPAQGADSQADGAEGASSADNSTESSNAGSVSDQAE